MVEGRVQLPAGALRIKHSNQGPDGELWVETSNHREAVEAMRPGDTLYRWWVKREAEWREESKTE